MYKTIIILAACVAVAELKKPQVEYCSKESLTFNHCLTHTLNSTNKMCRFYNTTESAFSFYLNPGSKFKLLKIAVSVKSPLNKGLQYIKIKKDKLSDLEKWYHIELKEFNQSTYTYIVYIDGKPYNSKSIAFDKRASMFKFVVKGLPSHYALCNPSQNVTQPPPSLRPAPVMSLTTPSTVSSATTPSTVPPATTPSTVPPATTPSTTVPPDITPSTVPPATTPTTTVPPATTPPTTVPPAITPNVPSTPPPAPVTTVLPPKPASRPVIENHPNEADLRGDHYQTRYNTQEEDKPHVASRSITTMPSLYIILTATVPGTLLVITVVVVILAIRRRRLTKGRQARESTQTGEAGDLYFLCQQNLPDLTRSLGQNPDDYVYDEEADQGLVTFQGRGRRGRRDNEDTML